MRDLNKLTVVALKELLAARGLPSAGAKAELIARMMEADPSGAWMDGEHGDGNDDEEFQQAGASNMLSTMDRQQREVDLYRREKELAERELAIVRLELEVMRREFQIGRNVEKKRRLARDIAATVEHDRAETTGVVTADNNVDIPTQFGQSWTNLADLLSNFDRKSSDYEI